MARGVGKARPFSGLRRFPGCALFRVAPFSGLRRSPGCAVSKGRGEPAPVEEVVVQVERVHQAYRFRPQLRQQLRDGDAHQARLQNKQKRPEVKVKCR